MTLKIEIEMDNEAFGENPGVEAGRILFEYYKVCAYGGLEEMDRKLRDINGNTVGKAQVKP